MPATSPRFTITVAPGTDHALKRLAAVQGRPVASLIREYLDGVAPVMADLADAMEAVRTAEALAREELGSSLADAAEDMRPHIEGIAAHLRALAHMEAEPASADTARGPGAPGPRAVPRKRQPPLCNTGVVNG